VDEEGVGQSDRERHRNIDVRRLGERRLLPIDGNELTRYDPITKSLHAQWERIQWREGVLNRKF